MKKLRFYIIFLSLSILFLLFDWYYSRKLNLDFIKIIIYLLQLYLLVNCLFSLMQSLMTVLLILFVF